MTSDIRSSIPHRNRKNPSGFTQFIWALYAISIATLGLWGFLYLTRTPSLREPVLLPDPAAHPDTVAAPKSHPPEKSELSEQDTALIRLEKQMIRNWDRERQQLDALVRKSKAQSTASVENGTSNSSPFSWTAPPTVTLDGVWDKIALPSTVTECRVGREGKTVVLRSNTLPGLYCLDLETRTIRNTLRLESADFLYAAGKNSILVYNPGNKQFITYSYAHGNPLHHYPFTGTGTILSLKQGISSDKALVTIRIPGPNPHNFSYLLHLMDARNGNRHASIVPPDRGDSYNLYNHVYATNASMSRALVLNNTLFLNLEQGTMYPAPFTTEGKPGEDSVHYDKRGRVIDATHRNLSGNRYTGYLHSPDTHLPLFASIKNQYGQGHPNGITVELNSQWANSPLASLGVVPTTKPAHSFKRSLASDWGTHLKPEYFERMVLNIQLGRFFVLPSSGDYAMVRTFDPAQLGPILQDRMIIRSIPPPTVKRGQEWNYRIKLFTRDKESASEKDRFTLMYGPEGLQLSDRGFATWSPVAENLVDRPHPVLVEITSPAGKKQFYYFTLFVRP